MATSDASRDQIADRISAYVYGNILVLSSLVVVHHSQTKNGFGVAIVVGTALSTFIAHAFAERLGSTVREHEHSLRETLRDSMPILTSAAIPAGLLAMAAFGWLSPTACLRLAEAWVIGRMATTAFVMGRLQGRPVTMRTWIESLSLAAIAIVIVVIKVVLTH